MTSNDVVLSAAMIIRDEALRLEACLRSIQALADEIVVVDTGSNDGSVGIARQFGARVYQYQWHDDFAAARNYGLDRCRGQWILYIDADERVRPCSRADLLKALAAPDTVGHSVLLHARTGFTAYRELRVFRNDPRIRFDGPMHETIWPGIARYTEDEGGWIGDSGLALDHVGYDGPQDHKHRRNLPLLKRALAANPEHVYCWYHLGIVHFGLGAPDLARQAWESGVAAVRRKKSRWATDALPFVELIQYLISVDEDVGSLLGEARQMFPEDTQLVYLEGQVLLRQGRLEESISTFKQLVQKCEEGRIGADIGYDRRQYTSVTFAAIASCYFRLARYGEGRRWFARAEEHDRDNLEYRVKRLLCEHLERGGGTPEQSPGPNGSRS